MLDIVDRVSLPGAAERANEDACGAAGAYAWVIDGSIPAGHPLVMDARSDAAWFTAHVSERLAARVGEGLDGPDLVRAAVADARDAFLARAPDRADPLTWPLAAITLVRAGPGRLDAWSLADTVAYVLDGSGACRVLGEAPGLRRRESRAAADLLARTGRTPADIGASPEFQAWVRANRARMVSGEGLAVLSLDPAIVSRLEHRSVPVEGGAHALIASDGFSALVELYEQMDAPALMRAALAGGLAPLAAEVRRIETELDPDGRLFPRFKQSDDATALLVRWSA